MGSWNWNGKTKKVQSPVVLDESGSNTTLYIQVKRNNLKDISKKMLMRKYPQLKGKKTGSEYDIFSVPNSDDEFDDVKQEEEEDDDIEPIGRTDAISDYDIIEQKEDDEKEEAVVMIQSTTMEMAKLMKK